MSESAYVYVTKWGNLGLWIGSSFRPMLGVRTPWGNLIFKRYCDRLFSERYTNVQHLHIGGIYIRFVRLRMLA